MEIQMHSRHHSKSTRSLRLLVASTVCAALAACAGTAPRSTNSGELRASSKPVDFEVRDRRYQRAEAFYLSGRLKEAVAAFDELTHTYPRDSQIWLKYGNTLTKLGSYDNAATAFQTALSLDSSQGGAALNLALVRLAQAQDSLDAAVGILATNSTEHAQAENLQRQIETLLGTPDHGAASH
jgi:tetratricopeptide (TPR) repeat protein